MTEVEAAEWILRGKPHQLMFCPECSKNSVLGEDMNGDPCRLCGGEGDVPNPEFEIYQSACLLMGFPAPIRTKHRFSFGRR